jgi:DNA-binding NtrC family response regulator
MGLDGTLKALIVEDDPYWKTWFSSNLERMNADVAVHVADSIEKARKRLEENGDYDLIVCEQTWNGKSEGLDFWKSLQSKNSKIPFVLTSAVGDLNFIESRATEGPHPLCLEKNQAKDHFRRLIRQMVTAAATPALIKKVSAKTPESSALSERDQQLQQIVDCFW